MEMKKISTSKAAQPGGWYSQAFRIGDLIYTAGITGVDAEGVPMKFNNAYSQMFLGYPDAVSLQQAAEMLGLNRHTVGELIRSRRLFALKIGRTYRIPKLSVIEFLLTGQSTFPAGNPPLDVVCCGCSNGQHAC